MAREKFAGVADAVKDAGGDLGFAEVLGHRVPQSFPEFIAAMLNWNIRRRLYLCPDPWKLQENTIGSGLVSHARGMRHASHLQARCSGVASVLFSYSLRVLFVFSSYSLGILLVFCPSIPPAIPARLLQLSRAGAALWLLNLTPNPGGYSFHSFQFPDLD
jgi:hypothetical protein